MQADTSPHCCRRLDPACLHWRQCHQPQEMCPPWGTLSTKQQLCCRRHCAANDRTGVGGSGSATIWRCCRACSGFCRATIRGCCRVSGGFRRAGFGCSIWRQRHLAEAAKPQSPVIVLASGDGCNLIINTLHTCLSLVAKTSAHPHVSASPSKVLRMPLHITVC